LQFPSGQAKLCKHLEAFDSKTFEVRGDAWEYDVPKDATAEQLKRMQVEMDTVYTVVLYPGLRAGPGESAACVLVTVDGEKEWMLEDATEHLWSRREGQGEEAVGQGSCVR
tara:strand:+ start:298 stop:630 length:333 start_codon:yes stop_codon:yes gene_type:complete